MGAVAGGVCRPLDTREGVAGPNALPDSHRILRNGCVIGLDERVDYNCHTKVVPGGTAAPESFRGPAGSKGGGQRLLLWHALRSLPRSEKALAAAVPQLLSADFAVETYLPLAPIQKRGSKATAPEPLFPGYVFCRCDLEQLPLSVLQRTPGLRSVVRFDGDPAIVPDDAITVLQRRMEWLSEGGGLPRHSFKPGDALEIKSGPLKGLYAVFEGPMTPSERVTVLLEFIGQANRVSLPVESVEAVNSPPRRTRGKGRWLPGYGPRA